MEDLDWLESILIPVFGSKGAKDNLGKIYAWRDTQVAEARINELTKLDNDVTFCDLVCDDLFHHYYIDRLAELTKEKP